MITNAKSRKKLAQRQIAKDNKSQGKNDESLILELQVHQEELKMQNLELREAQQALEAARDRYADLYDFAPVGYVSLTEAGIIKDLNLTAANLFGKPRQHLLEYPFSRFILAAERHQFYHHLRHCKTEGWACTELTLLGKNGLSHQVQLYSTQVQDHTYGRLCRTAITDITQLKQAKEALRISETKYRKLFEEAIDGIGLADLETGLIIDCNPALARMVQRETSELIGQSQKILHPPEEHAGPVSRTFELHRTGKKDSVLEAKIITKTGEIREVEIKANIVRLEDREVVQGIFRDITERKRAEQALFEEKKRAQITLHSIGDGVITIDAHAIVNYLNPTAEALTGWTMAEACGRHLNEIFHLVNEQMHPLVSNPVVRCLSEGKIIDLAYQAILINRHGQEYYIEVTAASMRGQNGQVLGAVLALHDITETRRLTRQLEYDATHDALTGLINRAEFERRLERALASAQQYGARHALCYLDLDQFKIINDTAGHTAGDALLKKIHTLLLDRFRERDTLARLGGDEFGILLDNCPLDRAQVIAQAIVASIRKYRFNWEGHTYQIGVSIGLVPITAEAQGTAQLLTQADIACYTAKELGRNRVHVYQREDSETIQRHSEILGTVGLRNALEQGRFQLYYQPIFPLNTPDLRPVRYEVLLRMVYNSSPEKESELVLPTAFIPAAERYGLMDSIDQWVIQTAFRDYVEGIGQTGAPIAINLSGNSLNNETLLDFIEAQFTAHAFLPEQVCFEITETAAIQNLRQAREVMTMLKHHGCQFALDDFGNGLSSFYYLKTLPVDYLKIDGSFVKDMIENIYDEALIAAINQMSHILGIKTIAEYAHSQAIVERLRELGVDFAQGYFFGQPAPWGTSL